MNAAKQATGHSHTTAETDPAGILPAAHTLPPLPPPSAYRDKRHRPHGAALPRARFRCCKSHTLVHASRPKFHRHGRPVHKSSLLLRSPFSPDLTPPQNAIAPPAPLPTPSLHHPRPGKVNPKAHRGAGGAEPSPLSHRPNAPPSRFRQAPRPARRPGPEGAAEHGGGRAAGLPTVLPSLPRRAARPAPRPTAEAAVGTRGAQGGPRRLRAPRRWRAARPSRASRSRARPLPGSGRSYTLSHTPGASPATHCSGIVWPIASAKWAGINTIVLDWQLQLPMQLQRRISLHK